MGKNSMQGRAASPLLAAFVLPPFALGTEGSFHSSQKMEALSDYERKRELNIARNRETLERLGLAGPPATALQVPKKVKRKEPAELQRQPERKSSRLEGAKAPDFYIAQETSRGQVSLGGEVEEAKKWMKEPKDPDVFLKALCAEVAAKIKKNTGEDSSGSGNDSRAEKASSAGKFKKTNFGRPLLNSFEIC